MTDIALTASFPEVNWKTDGSTESSVDDPVRGEICHGEPLGLADSANSRLDLGEVRREDAGSVARTAKTGPGFARIPQSVWFDPRLDATSLAVLVYRASKAGAFALNVRDLKTKLGIGTAAAKAAIGALKGLGHISRTRDLSGGRGYRCFAVETFRPLPVEARFVAVPAAWFGALDAQVIAAAGYARACSAPMTIADLQRRFGWGKYTVRSVLKRAVAGGVLKRLERRDGNRADAPVFVSVEAAKLAESGILNRGFSGCDFLNRPKNDHTLKTSRASHKICRENALRGKNRADFSDEILQCLEKLRKADPNGALDPALFTDPGHIARFAKLLGHDADNRTIAIRRRVARISRNVMPGDPPRVWTWGWFDGFIRDVDRRWAAFLERQREVLARTAAGEDPADIKRERQKAATQKRNARAAARRAEAGRAKAAADHKRLMDSLAEVLAEPERKRDDEAQRRAADRARADAEARRNGGSGFLRIGAVASDEALCDGPEGAANGEAGAATRRQTAAELVRSQEAIEAQRAENAAKAYARAAEARRAIDEEEAQLKVELVLDPADPATWERTVAHSEVTKMFVCLRDLDPEPLLREFFAMIAGYGDEVLRGSDLRYRLSSFLHAKARAVPVALPAVQAKTVDPQQAAMWQRTQNRFAGQVSRGSRPVADCRRT